MPSEETFRGVRCYSWLIAWAQRGRNSKHGGAFNTHGGTLGRVWLVEESHDH